MKNWHNHGEGLWSVCDDQGKLVFRIFQENDAFWLSDVREDRKQSPSWECKTLKEAKELAIWQL